MADLRYRNARNVADRLGQVFTPPAIAALLAESIPIKSDRAEHILDLGAGRGALANAMLEKYRDATATLVEVDVGHVKALKRDSHSRTTVIQADVLGNLWECPRTPGVIVSNPPYGALQASMDVRNKIENSGLPIPFSGIWVRGDAAFAARAWGIATIGTKLGLIVASPMVRDSSYRPVREHFVHKLRGLCVTRLDEQTFRDAEVSAFLITGQKAVRRNRNVLLRKVSAEGSLLDEIEIAREDAVLSLDIDFHVALRRLGLKGKLISDTLGSVGTVITRGSRSQNDFEKLGLDAFHTCDFPDVGGPIILSGKAHDPFHIAKPGDILIPRVGSRCLVKQARVENGYGLFTDCVYRLVVSGCARTKVWKTLNSAFGAEWRLIHAGGSCAKHLPIQTLYNMPLMS